MTTPTEPNEPVANATAAPAAAKPSTWMNIAALVTGILCLPIIPVIFGHLGVSQANKGRADYKGLGIAGLILGYLEIVAGVIFLVFAIVFVTNCDNIEGCNLAAA